jgi:hypothetical protein
MRRSFLATITLLPACFAAPELDVPSFGEGSTGIALDGGDEQPYVPEGSSEDEAGDTEGPASTSGTVDPSDTDATTGELPGTTGVDPTVADEDSGETGIEPVFPTPEPFGDDVRELDLVGTWTVPWDPNGVPDVMITIAADGTFTWIETEADCSPAGSASGQLWVESSQLVMHVDAWDKKDPWDVQEALGEPLAVPFRMRLGYAPMGGFLGISARKRFTDVMTWRGVGYVRVDAGSGPQGQWIGEAELWGVPAGASEPQLLVRDRYSANLLAGGAALVDHSWTWWWPEQGLEETDAAEGDWIDQTPGNVAGAVVVDGDTLAYDATQLMSFEADRAFKLGVVSDCP